MIKLQDILNELSVNPPHSWNIFRKQVDDWVYEIASWSDLDWEEEERIFKSISKEDWNNYFSLNYYNDLQIKYNDNTDQTVLSALHNAWEKYKEGIPFEEAMKQSFPDDNANDG